MDTMHKIILWGRLFSLFLCYIFSTCGCTGLCLRLFSLSTLFKIYEHCKDACVPSTFMSVILTPGSGTIYVCVSVKVSLCEMQEFIFSLTFLPATDTARER